MKIEWLGSTGLIAKQRVRCVAGVVGVGSAAGRAGGRAAVPAARARDVEPAAAGAPRGPGAGRAGDAAGRAGGRPPQVSVVPPHWPRSG